MKVQLTSISVIALFAASCGAALAQSESGQEFCDTGYVSADDNSDGAIDKQELEKVTEAEFSSLDANNDGTVTRAEYTDCRGSWTQMASNTEPMTEADFATMDSNQDGSIDQNEYMDAADQTYTARWGETGTDKEVRDADMAPATPENEGGVGGEHSASDSDTQGESSNKLEEEASSTQTGSEQSDASNSQASASGGATDDAASGSQKGQPEMVLRRIIFIPQGAQRSPGDMSREEVAHRTALRFLLLDANRNQVIDPEEQKGSNPDQASMDDQMNQQFDRADADKSGDLSREEYSADMQSRWDQARGRQQDAADNSNSDQQASSGDDVGAPVVYYRYPHRF